MTSSRTYSTDLSDLVEILAHLDSLLEGPKSRLPQNSDAEQQIRDVLAKLVTNLGPQHTVEDVRTRLWHAFRRGEVYPENSFLLLFHFGSSEMKTLQAGTRHLVRQRLEEIRVRKAFLTPQGLRSRSVRNLADTPHRKVLRASRVSKAHKNRSEVSEKRLSRKTNPLQQVYHSMSDNFNRCVLKTNSREKIRSRSKASSATAVDEICEKPALSPRVSPTPSLPVANSPVAIETAATALKLRPRNSSVIRESESSVDIDHVGASTQFTYERSNANHAEIIAQVTHYKLRSEVAEEQCAMLRKEIRNMESMYPDVHKMPGALLKSYQNKSRQVLELREQLKNRKVLSAYFSISRSSMNALTMEQLLFKFRDMNEKLMTLPVRNGTEAPSLGAHRNFCTDLDSLFHTIFEDRIHVDTNDRVGDLP